MRLRFDCDTIRQRYDDRATSLSSGRGKLYYSILYYTILYFDLETWKHRQSAEQKPQDGYNCPATRQRHRPRLSRSSEGPCAQSGGQAKKGIGQLVRFRMNLPFSLFKCIQKNNSPWSPAHMLQMMSCSAVVWSQSHLPSHSLINNVIVCNKSFYCSIINRKIWVSKIIWWQFCS